MSQSTRAAVCATISTICLLTLCAAPAWMPESLPAEEPTVSTFEVPEQEPPDIPETPPREVAEVYDFSQPVPEREPVENNYFQDAAFVGDSRTDGFLL